MYKLKQNNLKISIVNKKLILLWIYTIYTKYINILIVPVI